MQTQGGKRVLAERKLASEVRIVLDIIQSGNGPSCLDVRTDTRVFTWWTARAGANRSELHASVVIPSADPA